MVTRDDDVPLEVVELAVEGMMCMKNCGATVQSALRGVAGVASAVVDFERRSARVECEPGARVTAADLVDAVECVGFGAAVQSAPLQEPTQQQQATDALTIELLVEGMMCQKNCGSTVENALRGVDGVAAAVVSFEQRKATVTLRRPGSSTLQELVDMVECVGFEARAYDAARAAAIKLQAQQQQQKEKEQSLALDVPDAAGHPRAVFHVEGMSCAACVKAIEDHVGKAEGVLHCRVGLISQKAEVAFDRDLVRDEQRTLRQLIQDAGYKATFSHVVEPGDDDSLELKFTVTGMSCAACVGKIESAVGKLPGVTKVLVNLPLNKAHVHLKQLSKTGPRDVLECINGLGYSAEVALETTDQNALSKSEVEKWRKLLTTAMLFSLPAMLIHMVLMYIPPVEKVLMTPVFNSVSVKLLLLFLLSTPIQFGVGWRFYVAAWKGLQHGAMGMDFLVVAGTTMSYTYSFVSLVGSAVHENYHGHHFFESSAMLLTFVTLGKYMESMAKGKTADALSELAKLQPKKALLITNGKRDREIPIELVQRGDLLRILPGANIPTDGVVKSGSSSADESMLTVVADRAYTPRELLYYGASLECVSEHVLGKAIVVTATEHEKLELQDPTEVHVVPGRGIEGVVAASDVTSRTTAANVMVGNSEFCEEKGIEIGGKMRAHMHELELEGKTVVVVCVENKLAGVIALADAPRPEAAAVVGHLKSMGLDVWLITGDNLRTASAIARQMGINHVKAVALPGEKASQIKALQSQVNPLTLKPRVVCMVGDGINDAPALAQSDIGMAIGAGTQIAKAEADMVLVKSALTDVVVALDLARVVFSRIKLNFFFSIVYNVVGIPLAAGMFFPLIHRMMPPACAGLAMAFSSVSVVISSLLLKKYKAPQLFQAKLPKVHFEEDVQVVDLKNLVGLKAKNVRYAPLTNLGEKDTRPKTRGQ
ncbi:putative copper-transporting ATPase [Phytophthora cinnamomi]|uniref:putative copper-transporting ATPase n=1 Tax=Phytophthora cinnamomi TaxID=4785 RepID=UPI00355AB172|nr:putative copper-transporting ATPase [Phytophthora cinnamomi]